MSMILQPPGFLTTASGFRAHPRTIIAQNQALRDRLTTSASEARNVLQAWLDDIKERDLAEKRRKAPGWLDSNEKMLTPERLGGVTDSQVTPSITRKDLADDAGTKPMSEDADVTDLGSQMDRAFG